MSIGYRRREYRYGTLTRESLKDCPFEQFQAWLDDALASPIKDPTAMTVATLDEEGSPVQRAVLLKGFDQQGFVFYTNLGGHKAEQIKNNARASLHFPWFLLDRQVSVSGSAELVSRQDVENYFADRPRESQLAAWASRQSSPIASREELEAAFTYYQQKFDGGDVPLPDFWGGFRVVPEKFEFWQGGEMRLHDRFQYLPDASDDKASGWTITRLAP